MNFKPQFIQRQQIREEEEEKINKMMNHLFAYLISLRKFFCVLLNFSLWWRNLFGDLTLFFYQKYPFFSLDCHLFRFWFWFYCSLQFWFQLGFLTTNYISSFFFHLNKNWLFMLFHFRTQNISYQAPKIF